MNVITQVISIAAAIAILILIGVWMVLRQRDKKPQKDVSQKIVRQSTRSSRLRVRRNEKTTGHRTIQDVLPEWKEIQPVELPEKEETDRSPELEDSSSQARNIVAITPPGKNGRAKH